MYIELQAKLRRRRRIQKNLTLMVVICLIIFGVFMALRPAHAQGIYMGRDGRVHAQVIVGADGTAWPVAPTYCQHGWGPCPVLLGAPFAPPPAYAPPPPDAPPVPMGWVYGPYTAMGPDGVVRVSVGADGLNVRTMPNGPVLAALANGVPLLPLQQQGNWVLVAPACPLAPTYTWSVTAGGVPLSVCM